ncbi:hypothetical protein K491DRAFT_719182 [Lophiostoma macrostomum CBS 122681]|uniref:Uncharacterized protein n=1 Tax=Lophiostoma macrostomum CBS 122681 TaxID=1314788 RepID=A0A6A6SX39_9PLEO|nr:hypothetical protein K491DRAFT_719182 [Lophiostoma macrostomum CBS 122681]
MSTIYLILSIPSSCVNASYPLDFVPGNRPPTGLSSDEKEKWIDQQLDLLSKPWYKIYSASPPTHSTSTSTARKVPIDLDEGKRQGGRERYVWVNTHSVNDIYGGGAGKMDVMVETSAEVNAQPKIAMHGWSRNADAAQRMVGKVQGDVDKKGKKGAKGTMVFVDVVPLL